MKKGKKLGLLRGESLYVMYLTQCLSRKAPTGTTVTVQVNLLLKTLEKEQQMSTQKSRRNEIIKRSP